MSTCTKQVRNFVSLFLFISIFLAPSVHAASPSLLIGEVAWAGSSLSTADEWLELWNTSDAPLPLAGYELAGASSQPIIFGSADIIPPHSAFLISNYDANNPKTILTTPPNLVTTDVSLPNDKLAIILKDPSGVTVDQAGDGSQPPAGSSTNKTSMLRQADLSWQSATTSLNIKTGSIDQGTPGFCDGCIAPSAVETQYLASLPPPPTDPSPPPTDPIIEPDPITIPDVPTSTDISIAPDQSVTIEPTSTVEQATTTDATINPEQATTTVPMPDATGTDGIQGTETQDIASLQEQIPPEPTSTVEQATTTIIISIQPRIYQAMSNPSSGPEWIELDQIAYADLPYLQDWTFEDAVGPIYHFSATSTEATSTETGIKIHLSKNHLNNDGDKIKLKDQHGQLMDQVDVPTRTKDQVWNRDEVPVQPTAATVTPTPSIDNEGSTEPTSTIIVQGIPIPVTNPIPVTVGANVADPVTPTFAHAAATATAPIAVINTKPTSTKQTAIKTVKTKIAKPKTTRPKTELSSTKSITSATFDMLSHINPKTHIRLIGTVGSLPGQVGQNYFIIHNPDGRGLLVHSNQNQPIPPLGTRISVAGLLSLTDTNLFLAMQKLDKWTLEPTSTATIQPRAVDLIIPSQEDAWSFVDVTATVLEVKGSTIYLDIDGIDLQAKIKPMVRYRASRLNPGDLIRVRGLLDVKGDVPAVYPRSPDEIVVLHAASAKLSSPAATTSNSLPTWTPFGAAGATIAFTQGYKKLKQRREKRVLEQAIAKVRQTKAAAVLPTSTQLDNVPGA